MGKTIHAMKEVCIYKFWTSNIFIGYLKINGNNSKYIPEPLDKWYTINVQLLARSLYKDKDRYIFRSLLCQHHKLWFPFLDIRPINTPHESSGNVFVPEMGTKNGVLIEVYRAWLFLLAFSRHIARKHSFCGKVIDLAPRDSWISFSFADQEKRKRYLTKGSISIIHINTYILCSYDKVV